MNDKLVRILYGHPDEVHKDFARPKEEFEDIISKVFRLGKKIFGYSTMLANYVPSEREEAIMVTWYADSFYFRARSLARAGLDYGRFPLFSVGDARSAEARRVLKSLEVSLAPRELNVRVSSLEELEEFYYKED